MARHSLPWDRSGDAAAETASKKSGTSTRKSTLAFFYPPLTPPATSSNHAVSEPLVPSEPRSLPPLPPHPYASGSYDYHSTTPTMTANSQLSPGLHPSVVSTASSAGGDGSTAQSTYVNQYHHHHHSSLPHNSLPPHPPTANRPAPTRLPFTARSRFHPLIPLILFLPLPPLLSVLYLIIGHTIFRRASPSSQSWSAPILSTANAGATGGIILSPPLFLLLFLLLSPVPNPTSPARTAHEDFFDDDEESHTGTTKRAATTYAAFAGLMLGVGAAAGPLGVTCLGKAGSTSVLAPGKAAQAGIVGGSVLFAGVLIVFAIGAAGWSVWGQSSRMPVQGVDGSKD